MNTTETEKTTGRWDYDPAGDQMKFLVKWLYHGSTYANQPTAGVHLRAFEMGDGYGKMTQSQLLAQGLSWDWSHIRDSSDAAKNEVERFLKTLGYK